MRGSIVKRLHGLEALRTRNFRLLFGGQLVSRRPLLLVLLAALVLVPELWLVAGTAPLAAIVVAGLFGGAGLILGNTVWETTLQQRIPADVLSHAGARCGRGPAATGCGLRTLRLRRAFPRGRARSFRPA